ncbi:MAG TPA: CYTH and CHAD domain-containing protein [Jatrophihabitans sp.]|jgi:CHAD domain-containing protein|nr:CYTH and CHAD domain-containing protein [Jatrophihabitans sp.]
MAQRHREREDKYDVEARFSMPGLDDLVPAGGRLEHTVVHLDSRYFDTKEHDLLASGVTLRRRTGDTDTGWQLKVPEGKARTEIRLPADEEAVPGELADLVRAVRHDRPLAEVARVRTERSVARLRGPDDATLVEVADDTVHAAASGAAAMLTQWREVEVELGAGDPAQLDEVRDRLVQAGARPSASSSKLARALDAEPTKGTSGSLVTTYLRSQYAVLVAGDVALRQHRDAIHATRVATRRIRSTLRIFGAPFDERLAADLDAELSWYADALGEVRDRQVQRARFAAAIDELPDELVVRSFGDDVDAWLKAEQTARGRELDEALDSPRYLRLLREVRDCANARPFTEGAGAAPATLKRLTRRARDKAEKRLRQATRAAAAGADDETVDAALHRARKAAKRARYAVELTGPAHRAKRAKKIIKHYKKRQDLLGAHQDAVVAGQLLRDHATRVGAELPMTYGLLLAREDEIARRTREQLTEG